MEQHSLSYMHWLRHNPEKAGEHSALFVDNFGALDNGKTSNTGGKEEKNQYYWSLLGERRVRTKMLRYLKQFSS